MGTITHLTERLRPVPSRIGSEEEALSAAADFAATLQTLDETGRTEQLSRSGLLAISSPSDFGGADVANAVLLRIVVKLARIRPDVADLLVGHWAAMEVVRTSGTLEQRKAIFSRVSVGERLCLVEASTGVGLSADGIGYALNGSVAGDLAFRPDWIVIGGADISGEPCLLFVAGAPVGPREENAGGLIFHDEHVAADAILLQGKDAGRLSGALQRSLVSARLLGLKESRLRSSKGPEGGEDAFALGRRLVEIELLSAVMERAGASFDLAQINPTPETLSDAVRLSEIFSIAAMGGGEAAADVVARTTSLGQSWLSSPQGS